MNGRDELFESTPLISLLGGGSYNVKNNDIFGVTQVLLNAGSDVNAQDQYGYTPLLRLLSYGTYVKEDGKENKKLIDFIFLSKLMYNLF